MVRASGLVKSFGQVKAVRSIDFDIARGEVFGFLGPNGAGKSTTMKMIYALVRPDAGSLSVSGVDVVAQPRLAKSRLGVVPQDNNLDPDLSVLQNLTGYARYYGIPHKEALKRSEALLEFWQLTEKRDVVIYDLSGGMQRRLVLARGLIHEPEVLVLDEPTTGLDPQARQMVWQKVRALKRRGLTILLTTHYMEEAAQLCDRLAVMDQGRILVTGTPGDLVADLPGQEVVEVHTETPGLALKAGAYLGPGEEHADSAYWFTQGGKVDLDPLIAAGFKQVTRRPANLEDVFLKLTGRELGEE
jgi:lipooligosaccharide transport system ATP-binding protein